MTPARDRSRARDTSNRSYPPPEAHAAYSPSVLGGTGESQILTIDESVEAQSTLSRLDPVDVVVAGSVAVDLSCDYRPITLPPIDVHTGNSKAGCGLELAATRTLKLATSNPASIKSSIGGVGHNVALALHYLGVSTGFYSAVGNDPGGTAIVDALKSRGLSTQSIQQRKECRTAQYVALNNVDKSLFTAVADMSIFDGEVNKIEFRAAWQPLLEKQRPEWVILDANWSCQALQIWINLAKSSTIPARLIFEPVSVEKSTRAFPLVTSKRLLRRKPTFSLTTPNEYELKAMFEHITSPYYLDITAREKNRFEGFKEDNPSLEALMQRFNEAVTKCLSRIEQHDSPRRSEVEEAAAKAIYLLRYFESVLVKFGSSGALQVSTLFKDDPRFELPATRPFLVDEEAIRVATVSHLAASVEAIYLRWHPPAANVPADEIVSVNGVGDTFLGVLVAGLARTKQPIEELIHVAQLGAVMTLKSSESVSDKLRMLEFT